MTRKAIKFKHLILSLLTLALIVFTSQTIIARNYYFSTTLGNDTRTSTQAQNPATPWKSISKLNSFFASLAAGDSVLFKRGETFYGSIVIAKSGTSALPIVIGAYGTGNNPVISGFQTVTGWTNKGGNVWESSATNCKPTLNMVTVNNVNTAMGRFPNAGTTNGGYLTYESSTATSLTDTELTGTPIWTGAEAVIKKAAWVISRCPITNHVGSLLTYTDESGYVGRNGWGYFIQNDIRTLDIQNEWFFNKSTKKLSIYSTVNPSGLSVRASIYDTLVYSIGKSYLTFTNLQFEGGNLYAFYIPAGDHIKIENCSIKFIGEDAVYSPGHSYLTVNGCNISDINDNVITGNSNSRNLYFGYCNVNRIYLIPGNAGVGDGHGFGIRVDADNSIAEYNSVKNAGYFSFYLNGNNTILRNNYIDSACLIKDDGGAIYISGALSTIMSGRFVQNNIVKSALGNGKGKSSSFTGQANGIYADGYANNVTIDGNTVTNCTAGGIYLGFFAHDLKIINNTLYNNKYGLSIIENDLVDNNCIFNENIFATNGSSNLIYAINGALTKVYRPIESFGKWTGNYYIKPFGDKNVLSIRYNVGSKTIYDGVTLNGWKQYDATMKVSPINITPYKTNKLLGSNTFSNETFTSNTSGVGPSYWTGTPALTWDNSNKINGGSAKLTYSSLATSLSTLSYIFSAGSVTAGTKYILSFDVVGTKANKAVAIYLRQHSSPGGYLTPDCIYYPYTTTPSRIEVLLEPSLSSIADIYLAFRDEDGPVYIDNVAFYEADVAKNNPEETVRFHYNATNTSKTITLPFPYVDVKGTSYSNSITLLPYTSVILIKDPNANQAPGILNQNFQINENSINGSTVGTVIASDPNVGQTLTYSILSGNTNGAFAINTSTGVLTVANSAALNFEVAPSFPLIVKVTDNGTPNLSSQATITVKLVNLNEKPVINAQSYSVIANSANGTVVGSVLASDPDAGQVLTYSIISGNTNNAFSINPSNGVLTVSASAALNYQATPTFSLVIKVVDNGTGNLYNQGTIIVNLIAGNSCSASGNILYQVWNNLGTSTLVSSLTTDVNYPDNPANSTFITSMEGTSNNLPNGSGARIAGYICAPSTGSYTFWIASDDYGELWLSSDDQPANLQKIAYVNGYTLSRQWDKYTTQKSVAITLIQGKKYYIEALMKEATGGDNLAVGWLKPGEAGTVPSEIIPGSVLSPYTGPVCSATGTIAYQVWNNLGTSTMISSLTGDVNYPDNPATSTLITSMEETPNNLANGSGARIAGYICAPLTGSYTFWIASDDYGELWLSLDDQTVNKQKIAYVNGFTLSRQWDKYTTQKSAVVNLVQGQTYYIEALMKEATGGDNLAVGWLKPGETGNVPSEIIPGSVLSPLVTTKSKEVAFDIPAALPDTDITLSVYPNPLSNDELNIKIENLSSEATLQIFSMTGVECYKELIQNSGTAHIDRSVFKSGFYIIKVFNNEFLKSTKLVVR